MSGSTVCRKRRLRSWPMYCSFQENTWCGSMTLGVTIPILSLRYSGSYLTVQKLFDQGRDVSFVAGKGGVEGTQNCSLIARPLFSFPSLSVHTAINKMQDERRVASTLLGSIINRTILVFYCYVTHELRILILNCQT